ncbi:sigma-54-dependent Fis family transcriptional regulator [Klebsiella sp. BIGb0407]|uniref:sigma-54 interaction domain-containing protein n=1 Tax=Klebsiella sp. BIGb0407 TaxID=2940603 RepID=UPI0021671243|nr:sigma-54 dependent transcriptional regulator [Klebsiella sp. BIGb0407]MCS3429863.1 DNA-binding NtrC family response regulator [Klebsiella sp. BIGb0407]
MTLFSSSAGPRRSQIPRVTAQIFEDLQSLALLDHMQKIAPSEASVLIAGATGTGKELVARHIHNLSHRREGPFLAVNCGAFADTLVEAELFGHEKGAFVGALNAQAGWFEEANGGTLFLDEIGDLPLAIQVKLLRVLQEREVVRLGSRKSLKIDVRVLAATNTDLSEAIRQGRFREDLFYRLNVVSLQLLPLRERSGDILPLARHFIHQYCTRLGYHQVVLSDAACQQLTRYSWPGNIRELENVIHHALLVCTEDTLLPEHINLQGTATKTRVNGENPALSADELLTQALEAVVLEANGDMHARVEDALIRLVYRHCRYNQVHTANLLGLSRNVIRAHLIRLGELVVNKRQK